MAFSVIGIKTEEIFSKRSSKTDQRIRGQEHHRCPRRRKAGAERETGSPKGAVAQGEAPPRDPGVFLGVSVGIRGGTVVNL